MFSPAEVDVAMDRGGLQSGNFGPGLLGGTVSSADLAAGNMSTTSVPGATGSVSTNAAGSISPAQASGMVSAIGPLSGGTGTNAAANAAAAAQMAASQAIAEAQQNTSPVISLPAINVSPEQIAQDMTQPSIAQTTTTPSTYSEKGLLGKVAQDIAMGLSINPFASRDQQAAQLAAKGYSQADIQGYFSRTDATVSRNAANVEAAQGAADFKEKTKRKTALASTPSSASQSQGFFVPRRAARMY
jgi:hypothetical protein